MKWPDFQPRPAPLRPFDAVDGPGRFWQPSDKAAAPARELPHRHAEAQLEPARLHQNHPCNRERIHTITNDRRWRAAVTTLYADPFVPSACRWSAAGRGVERRRNW